MVGLAKELEGSSFHLVLSYNQRGNPETALHEAFQNGLALLPSNVSVTLYGDHPGLEGTGYVPYYALFGPDGALIDHHQGGPYHGGNGDTVLGKVRELVAEAPALYFGAEPFVEREALSKALRSSKGSRGRRLSDWVKAVHELDALVKQHDGDQELNRLAHGVTWDLARTCADLTAMADRDPAKALEKLQALYAPLKGTHWAEYPLASIKVLVGDDSSAPGEAKVGEDEVKAAALLRKIETRWAALEPLKVNGREVRNPRDRQFRSKHAKAITKLATDLRDLSAKYPDSIAARDSLRMMNLLGGDPSNARR